MKRRRHRGPRAAAEPPARSHSGTLAHRGRAGRKDRQATRQPGGNGDGKPAPRREARPGQTAFYGEIRSLGAGVRVRLFHRQLAGLEVAVQDWNGFAAETGDVVRVKLGPQTGGWGPVPAKVLEVLGKNPRGLASAVAIENHGLPVVFADEVLEEAEDLPAFDGAHDLGKRTDWRKLKIVTIDGADARDFDDAVWAAPFEDGYRVIVAIADVAHYVRPGTPLDEEARQRGNSTYLPDRVLPMLPERLSNDLCSLRPREDRPVVGVEMVISGAGRLLRHTFHRGVIHSAARLTYEQVQQALDGNPDDVTAPLMGDLRNLQGAFRALLKARQDRGALDLDLPEAKVVLGEDGQVAAVAARPRLEAHRLIEELMITANVAAADVLSKKGVAGLYRIHDRPDKMKQMALQTALGPLGFITPGPQANPLEWARLAAKVQEHPAAQSLLRLVLQSQQQARYSPENIGHFGLALPLYAHFTSPIRRYSDLVVHRGLIAALGLPGAGGDKGDPQALARLGEHLALTERTSQYAEWEARDRLIAQYYDALTGETFSAVVMSVQPFGLFVAIDTIAEGLLPARMLGEGWQFVPHQLAWTRQRNRLTLRPGARVNVRLVEADRVAGRLTFARVERADSPAASSPSRTATGRDGRRPRRG